MAWQHKQNMYASHFTNYLLGFLTYMNIVFCWAEQGFQLTLASPVVTYSDPTPFHSQQLLARCQASRFMHTATSRIAFLAFLALWNLQCATLRLCYCLLHQKGTLHFKYIALNYCPIATKFTSFIENTFEDYKNIKTFGTINNNRF
jgi:hypothetical protein